MDFCLERERESFYLFSFDEIGHSAIIINATNIKSCSSSFATQSKFHRSIDSNNPIGEVFTVKLTITPSHPLHRDRFQSLHTSPSESNIECQY